MQNIEYKLAATRQSGVALIVGLIMLILLTIIGVTAMQTSILEERMAGNLRDRELAFQAAEAVLRECEQFLTAAALPPFNGTDGLFQPASPPATPVWQVEANWTSARTATKTIAGAAASPRCLIEELAPISGSEGSLKFRELPDTAMYRITARGFGGSSNTMVVLQTTYKR